MFDKNASIEAGDLVVKINSDALKILKWAKENGMAVRGHTLVWHNQTPRWFFAENWSVKDDAPLVDAQTSTLVHVAPLALNGHCRYTDFVVDGALAAAHAGDVWKVYLLDTRRRNGALAEADAKGRPVRINGFGETDGLGRFGATPTVEHLRLGAAMPVGSITDRLSSAAFAPTPRITGIRIEDGKAVLTVAGTVPSLDYDLAGGATPDALADGVAAEPVEGATEHTITLRADAAAGAGFFKVIRAK